MRISDVYTVQCHSCARDIELRAGAPGEVQHAVCPRCGAALELRWPGDDEPEHGEQGSGDSDLKLRFGKYEGCPIDRVPSHFLWLHLRIYRAGEQRHVLDAVRRELHRRAQLRRARQQADRAGVRRKWYTLADMAGEEARG